MSCADSEGAKDRHEGQTKGLSWSSDANDRTRKHWTGRHFYTKTNKVGEQEAVGVNHRKAGTRGKTHMNQAWLVRVMLGKETGGSAGQGVTVFFFKATLIIWNKVFMVTPQTFLP